MICFHEGDKIDRSELSAGIKRAFKKGIFLDIKAVSEPYEEGIKLKYIVKEIPIVKKINIEGNKKIAGRKIKKSFIFKKGEYFRDELLDKAKAELRHFYYRKGFPDADIKISADEDSNAGMVDINITVNEGAPLIISNVNIRIFEKHRIKISPGDIFDRDIVDNEIKRLEEYFKKKNYIKPVIGPYKFEAGELVITAVPGPRLEIGFKGNRAISSKRLLGEVPFLELEEVTNELLRESIIRMKRLYQKEGYYNVQISGGIEPGEKLIKVIYFIFEDKKAVLKQMRFEGISISPEAVKAVIPLQVNEAFNRRLLNTAKESIERFYNALGYIYAEVTDIREEFHKESSEVSLTFLIDQGTQILIGKIEIIGNRIVSTSEIEKVLKIKKQDPYNQIDVDDTRNRILSVYNSLGYINAEVTVERRIDSDKASINFKITEREPFIFGKIIISGNKKTKNKIIKREFDIREDEPYNYAAIFSTRQKLYKLGIFSEISIEPIVTSDEKKHTDKGIKAHTQDLLVEIKEGNPGAIEVGLGYGDYERLRGFFDISYRNLGGYNRQVGFRTELSSIEERYMLNYTEPWLFNKPSLPLNISLTKERTQSIDIDKREVRYKIDRLSFVANVEKEFSVHLKGSLSYEYSIVKTTDIEPGIVLTKEDTGTLAISSISPSLFYDTRDNPFDPQSGSLKGIILKVASKALLSESEFIKATLQSSWYFKLRKGLIFAFALKGGIAHGFGDTGELPIIERFFLGGRNTVRGYDHDELGPKSFEDSSEGTTTGGNVFVLSNAELRISLGKGFGLVAFVDAGNVWQEINDFEAKLRYTTGPGLRYNTPVGPFRVDYGYKLNREEGESAGEIHFSFGHAF